MLESKSSKIPEQRKTYQDKLRDPRWQKLRLLVMSREGFACQGCKATHKPLHVHHGYYEKGLEPWQYPTDTLWCLCDDCHREAESQRLNLYRHLGRQHPLQLHWASPESDPVSVAKVLPIFGGEIIRVEPSHEKREVPEDVCYTCGKHDPEKRVPMFHAKKRKVPKYRSICATCYEELTKDSPSERSLDAKMASWHGVYLDRLRKQQKKLAGYTR